MEHKKKKNKTVIIILEVLAFVLLTAGVFFGTYYIFIDKSSNSYEANVKKVINEINKINNSVASFNNGQTIKDTSVVRKDLPSKVDSLSKLKEDAEQLVPTDKYKEDHSNLLSGLDKNILIYRQIDAIFKNPEGKDIAKAGEDLKTYTNDCVKYYSLVNIKNIKISLPSSTTDFVNATSNYVTEMVKLQRDKDIKQTQNQEFIDSLDAVIAKFNPIKIDFSVQLSKIRSEKGNIDSVIALANKNKDTLEGISQEFANIAVPSAAVSSYKLFNKTLEDYDSYLQSFIFSAGNEKLIEGEVTSEKINELYSSANSKFKDVTKDYNDFSTEYVQFKETNSK